MSETETAKVNYVGPSGRGVVIQATDQRVRPKGSPKFNVTDPTTGEETEVPDVAEVPIDVAVRLCAQDIWEPATSRDAKAIDKATTTATADEPEPQTEPEKPSSGKSNTEAADGGDQEG